MLAILATSTVRVSLALAAALAVVRLLARRSAAVRHCLLATAVCCALSVPLLGLVLPGWHVSLPAHHASASATGQAITSPGISVDTAFVGPAQPTRGPTPSASTRPAGTRWTAATALLVLWLAGTLASALLLLAGFVRLFSVDRRSRVVNGGLWPAYLQELASPDPRLRGVVLVQSDHPSMLVTWGLWRPRIVLPSGAHAWHADRVRVVLAHEAEHIRRRDWLLQLAAEALRALYWFNPLAWMVASRLRLESERACDDAVLDRGIAPSEYAEHLVDLARALARPRVWVPAPAMARASSLERRVTSMLDPSVTRRPLTRAVRFSIVVIGLALTASIASFAAQSQFATVSGIVRDQLGGTLPSVTLTLTHAQSGAKHEIKSNESGAFEFVGLPAGNYTLAAFLPGFKASESALQLAGGQTARRDLSLDVGTLQETIMVHDGAPAPGGRGSRWSFGPGPDSACSAQPNSGGIKPPVKIDNTRPKYPASMRGTNLEGRVELQAVIGVDGAIRTVQTVEATNPDFEQAAQDAVRQWRFTPTLLNCMPVEVEMNVLTRFRPEAPAPPPPPAPPAPPQRP